MAVTSCKIQYQSQTYSIDKKFVEAAPVEWLIECDSRLDGPKTIRAQAPFVGPEPLPVPYAPYAVGNDYDEFMLVQSITLAREPRSDRIWRATVTYDNTLDPNQSADSPFERAPIDEWDFEQFQRLVLKDINDENIENSAGTALKIYADDSRPILTYTRNEPNYPSQILQYQDAINSDPFLVFPAYTAKVNIKAAKRWENGIKFYETKYTFNFRYDTWRQEILNEGNQFKVSGSTTGTFSWPNGYVGLLDENGEPLGTLAEPTFKTFKIYRELPFAPLNIIIY